MFGISLVTVKRNPEKGFEEEANLKKKKKLKTCFSYVQCQHTEKQKYTLLWKNKTKKKQQTENDPVGIHPVTQQSSLPSSFETCPPSVFPLPSTQRENPCEHHLTSAISHAPDPTDPTSLSPRSITCPGALPEVGWRLSPGEPGHLCSPSSPPASVTTTLAQGGSFSASEPLRTSSLPLKSLTVDGGRALTSQVGMCFWYEERVSVELLPPQRGEPQERERNPGWCCHPLKGSGGLAPRVPHTITAIAVPSLFLHHHYFWW